MKLESPLKRIKGEFRRWKTAFKKEMLQFAPVLL